MLQFTDIQRTPKQPTDMLPSAKYFDEVFPPFCSSNLWGPMLRFLVQANCAFGFIITSPSSDFRIFYVFLSNYSFLFLRITSILFD